VLTHEPVFAAIVTDPGQIRQILTNGKNDFHKGPNIFRFRYAIGDGTATSKLPADGSTYYAPLPSLQAFCSHKRKAIAPAFYPSKREFYTDLIHQLTKTYLADRHHNEVRDLYEDMGGLMLCIATNCLFGRTAGAPIVAAGDFVRASYEAVDEQIRTGGQTSTDVFDRGDHASDPDWRWQSNESESLLRKRRHLVHEAVEFLLRTPPLDAHRQDDLISLLRTTRYKDTGETMSDAQLLTSLIGLIFASYENSAATAAWTLWCLANDPARLERAKTEISQVLGNESVQGTDIDKLVYVQACVNESLRLYPPVWSMARETRHAVQLGDTHIPANSVLFLSPWVQHRREAVWPDAHLFRPERFLNSLPPHMGDFFPFGMGPRSCIGKAFGLWELTLVVATILKDWHITPAKGHAEPTPMLRATQRPEPGVYLQWS
ncbi:MAG: cytochrome P450, partial [Pseudomonadota bacterium]